MYALIQNDQIAQVGALPRLWHDGTRWWDYRHEDADPTAQGWHPVARTPRPDDTPATAHDYSIELVDGTPTEVWTARDKTHAEIEAEARLVSIEDRLARIEAKLWPAEPDPADTTGVPTWADHGGIAPAGALLLDGGKVWRNVSGVPLAHPPSGFAGWTEAQLAHLWALVVDPQPDPEPDPTYPQWRGEWSAEAEYVVGDHTSRGGVIYRCLAPHGPEYQGTWGPPTAGAWIVA